jgi:hypothetical protein
LVRSVGSKTILTPPKELERLIGSWENDVEIRKQLLFQNNII